MTVSREQVPTAKLEFQHNDETEAGRVAFMTVYLYNRAIGDGVARPFRRRRKNPSPSARRFSFP